MIQEIPGNPSAPQGLTGQRVSQPRREQSHSQMPCVLRKHQLMVPLLGRAGGATGRDRPGFLPTALCGFQDVLVESFGFYELLKILQGLLVGLGVPSCRENQKTRG